MTIARRLIILVAVPLLTLAGLGVFSRITLNGIESRTRLLAEVQIESIAMLGNFSRAQAEKRLNLRSYLLAETDEQRRAAIEAFETDKAEVTRLLTTYGESCITDEIDGRQWSDVRALVAAWDAGAERVFEAGRTSGREAALAILNADLSEVGQQLSNASVAWIEHNERWGTEYGLAAVKSAERAKATAVTAGGLGLAITAIAGVLIVGSIVRPVRALRDAVESVAKGDYSREVPFTAATDETGELARSISVLKDGARAMERQRWVKTNAAAVMAMLQGAETTEDFAGRLLSGLTPLLGGGVAAFYLVDAGDSLIRCVATFGLRAAELPAPTPLGEGLIGQAAAERKAIAVDGLPPGYLRIGSGLGSAAPTHMGIWPVLTAGRTVAVLEHAAFGAMTPERAALLDELLPAAGLSLEVLLRNQRTRELLDVTQKMTEDLRTQQSTLRASEEQFRTLLESTPDALIISDEAGRMIIVNAQAERLLGYTREEMIGQSIDILVPERFRAAHPSRRRSYHKSSAVRPMGSGMELSAVRKDGTEFAVEISLSPLRHRNGETWVCSSLRDISVRHRLEQAVRTNQQQLKTLVDSIRSVIFMKDREGRHLLVNSFYEQATGITRETVIGKTDLEVMPREAAEHIIDQDRRVMESAEPMNFEETVPGPDGDERHYLTSKVPLIDQDGRVYGMCGVATDITERKRAEAQIQRINFMSDSALDLTKAGYWHVPLDDSGWYNSSERAARIFGDLPSPGHRYRLDEWMQHVREGDEEAAKITAQNFGDAVAGKIPVYDATYAYKRPIDGRVVWIHALGHVVRDADGKPTDMFGVTQDITEFKELEAGILAAKAKAEEATKAKSSFLANMSHEIRTPMNGVIGMTELALDTELTAEQRDYLNTVKSSADALLSIINDILDFSKIEAGRIELDPVEFLLRDSISDTLSPLSLRASAKGVELAYDVSPDVPDALIGDVFRIRQVMVNLVGNAIKFTAQGEVVIEVRLVERRGDDVALDIRVRDTGIGISKEAASRLFKPFEQAETSTTRKFGGTGLGLAISRQLVELMGGKVVLESEPGKGSTFSFTVHLKVGTHRSTVAADDAFRLFAGKTALIVDDNQTNRRILEAMLGNWGLASMSADSAAAALAVLDRAQSAARDISILITDLHMPEVDGFDLVRAVRARGATGALPVIMLTSSADPGDHARSLELGIACRMIKPVKQSLLLDNLVLALSGPREISAAPAKAAAPAVAAATTSLRVLLAEDNPVNQKFALKVLTGAGHEVVVANNGREAVDRSGAERFDVVLMDVQMPELDGLGATREIRAREADGGGHLPIIAMTANAMAGDREMCLESGMDGYVAKPVKRDLLFAEMNRVLNEVQRG